MLLIFSVLLKFKQFISVFVVVVEPSIELTKHKSQPTATQRNYVTLMKMTMSSLIS